MNNKAVTLSLMMAVLALFFVQSYVDSEKQAIRGKYGEARLVAKAKRDIKEMDTIDETMVTIEAMPQKLIEPNAVSEKNGEGVGEQMKKNLIGQVAVVPIKQGEQITSNKMTEPSLRTGLAPQVSPGKRAIAIPVTETSGVAKLVKPGDRVDVIAILDGGAGRPTRVAKTVLQDAIVLAVGRNVTNNLARVIEYDTFEKKDKVRSLAQDFSFTSVTLEVDPAQAQMLVLVQAQADVPMSLSLRNNDDTDRAPIAGTLMDDLMMEDRLRIQRALANQPRK